MSVMCSVLTSILRLIEAPIALLYYANFKHVNILKDNQPQRGLFVQMLNIKE